MRLLTLPHANAASYIGNIATRCFSPFGFSNGNRNSRTTHYASVDLDGEITFALANWSANGSGGEASPPGTLTVTASFQYPLGTYRQVTWKGQTSITIQPGGTVWCDPFQVSLRKRTPFFVTQFLVGSVSNSIPMIGTIGNSNIGDAIEVTGSDKTMSGTVGTFQAVGFEISPPVAILGRTREPTIGVLGDSRTMAGAQKNTILSSVYGDVGELGMPLSPNFGMISLGSSGETASVFLTSHALRSQFFKYCTHFVSEYGINDFAQAHTSAQLFADQLAVRQLVGSKPFFLTTTVPSSLSSNNWTASDGSDQTALSSNVQRTAYCDAVRAGGQWWTPIELADYTELPPRNSGKWRGPGLTTDGTHETTLGNQQYVVAKELFARGGVGHMPQVFPL